MRIRLFILIFITPLIVLFTAMLLNAQWVRMTNGMPASLDVKAIATNGSTVYAGSPNYQMLYVSKNNGLDWTAYSTGVLSLHSFAFVGSKLFSGTGWGLIEIDTINYTFTLNSLNRLYQMSIAANGNYIYVGTSDSSIFISTDAGITWSKPLNEYNDIYSLYTTGSNVYAATSKGVLYSTNNGMTWTRIQYLNWQNLSVITKDNTILAGLPGGCIRSTNNGFSWIPSYDIDGSVFSMIIKGNRIIAGINSGNNSSQGISMTTNLGVNWMTKGEGLNYKDIYFVSANDEYIFAGSRFYGIWRRPLSEMVGVENISAEVPAGFSIKQNYPNPFNPTTNIEFNVPKSSDIRIKVYDLQGREVQTLVNERLNAGGYKVNFNGSSLNSGVYFYSLITQGFSDTKRMLLLK